MSILQDIEAFLETHGMAATAFGVNATNDRHLVRQLRTGRRLWPETEARLRRYMATYRPESDLRSNHVAADAMSEPSPSSGKADAISQEETR